MTIKLPEIKLLGITARTNNALEMDPSTAKIGTTIRSYLSEQSYEKISHRKNPGLTYCAYTNYESDMNGDYTYFIGEEVLEFSNAPEGLTQLTIPAQSYAKFTSDVGPMPNVCINLWQKIWKMSPAELGAVRRYHTDFELYDERARDPNKTELDIFIGIQS